MDGEAQELLDGRPRSVAGWRVLAWVVFGVIVAHSVVSAARIALLVEDHRLIDRLRTHQGDVTVEQVRSHRHTLSTVSNLDVVPTFLVLAAALVWFALLGRAIEAVGDAGKAAMSPWSYRAFWTAMFVWGLLSTSAGLAAPDPTDVAAAIAFDRLQIRYATARLVAAGFVLTAAWMIRRRGARITAP